MKINWCKLSIHKWVDVKGTYKRHCKHCDTVQEWGGPIDDEENGYVSGFAGGPGWVTIKK